MIPKHRAQPCWGQRLPTTPPFRDHEQARAVGLGPLSEQIGLDRAGDVRVDRNRPFLASLAADANPAAGDVHVRDCSPSTSAERSPDSSMSPPIARSRHVRKLPRSADDSSRDRPRGRRRGSRTRSFERGFGLPTCASRPVRSPPARIRAARPRGTGLGHRVRASRGTRTATRSPPAGR